MPTLVLIVRHPNDNQTYSNFWEGGSITKLKTITTNKKVRERLTEGQSVLIHRCAYLNDSKKIVCRVKVEKIDDYSRDSFLIKFNNFEEVTIDIPNNANEGQNFYYI